MFTITFQQRNFVELRARLKEAGNGGLTRELNKALKAAAIEVQAAEQTAARNLPSRGSVHTGLRSQIAAATAIRVTDSKTNPGVRVYVKERQVRGHLGSATDRPRGWRHPVFGNRNVWVRQQMTPGWWSRAYRPYLGSARDKVARAIQVTLDKIAKG